ncbi:MAG: aspartate carbamoyltransferase catalytic subunit [Actinomycetota bacterium]|nr:aspartate carbamoyltransferase catalytic subunit [Actinomycetota bacterium]
MANDDALKQGFWSMGQLDRQGAESLLRRARHFASGPRRLDLLDGVEIAALFFETSTRTRVSFEVAATRLGAAVINFDSKSSSLAKGESLQDTVETIASFGVDGMVVRSSAAGAPELISRWTGLKVVNAGDGAHQHPSQALLDLFTLSERLGSLDALSGLKVGIVGDIAHSRVARSLMDGLDLFGAETTLVAPATLMPPRGFAPYVRATSDFDGCLGDLDVVYLLRLQQERIGQGLIPSFGEYVARYSLTRERHRRLRPEVVIMHPGPVYPGMEVDSAVIAAESSLVRSQTRNGVYVRMAILEKVFGAGVME